MLQTPASDTSVSDQLAIGQRFQGSAPLDLINLLELFTALRETHLPVYYVIEDVIIVIGEQSDEETHRVRSGQVLSAGAPVPMRLGCHLLTREYIHQPEAL